MTEPKCPSCYIQGLEHIVSSDSVETSNVGDPWFNIAHCNVCGHVYGIFNKVSLQPLPLISNFED
ncbi:transcriptional regulator [Psychrobacillus sp.]|uniref:transcriptional regulator n=1 Tax=Psychrobacillus sp. TaxID=1871623 RepID=UPI0028BF0B78|nr:transcriptional regulator [Psychrobacillus sp.]